MRFHNCQLFQGLRDEARISRVQGATCSVALVPWPHRRSSRRGRSTNRGQSTNKVDGRNRDQDMFKKITDLASGASGTAKNLAGKASRSVSIAVESTASSAVKVKATGGAALDAVSGKGHDLIDQHWPKVERVVVDGLLNVAADKLKDEASVQLVLERAYEALPTLVRLALSRERYLEMVVKRKEPLLARIEEARARRNLSS